MIQVKSLPSIQDGYYILNSNHKITSGTLDQLKQVRLMDGDIVYLSAADLVSERVKLERLT